MGEVSFVDVSKRFTLRVDGELHHVQALDRVSFTVRDGEIVALIGPSGCGKTTALRVAMGLDPANGGRVTVDGREVHGCGYDRGMVFQHAELLPWLSAMQNVMFGLEMKGMRGQPLRETAKKYLDLVGLTDSQNRRPHQLSGGMKQRVGIARALAIDPKVLLMDEPFGALDAQTRESLQAELLEIHARTKKTILFVTHDLDEAVLIADRIVVMTHGRVQEIVDVPLARPRADLSIVRGLPEFNDTRYKIWRMLHEYADGALSMIRMVDQFADRSCARTSNGRAADSQADARRNPSRPLPRWAITLALGRLLAGAVGDFRPRRQSGVRLLSVGDRGGVLGAVAHRAIVVGAVGEPAALLRRLWAGHRDRHPARPRHRPLPHGGGRVRHLRHRRLRHAAGRAGAAA